MCCDKWLACSPRWPDQALLQPALPCLASHNADLAFVSLTASHCASQSRRKCRMSSCTTTTCTEPQGAVCTRKVLWVCSAAKQDWSCRHAHKCWRLQALIPRTHAAWHSSCVPPSRPEWLSLSGSRHPLSWPRLSKSASSTDHCTLHSATSDRLAAGTQHSSHPRAAMQVWRPGWLDPAFLKFVTALRSG